ncbi:MAG TPA: carboxylesterase family protein [Bryobacteraceae bacterium]|nr:carboxylesterase family protein [Bryobacteraceae bacterium]
MRVLRRRKAKRSIPGWYPGAEGELGGWSIWLTGMKNTFSGQIYLGTQFFASMVLEKPFSNYYGFDLDKDVQTADEKLGKVLNAMNPDLSAFHRRGGKLILYHGWSDAAVSPPNTTNYSESVRKTMVDENSKQFVRRFMVPAMEHCNLGTGPCFFGQVGKGTPYDADHDVNLAMERWVEQGVAPDRIIAMRPMPPASPGQKPGIRTRPLCPYPKVARWNGQGSSDDAANFACVDPPGIPGVCQRTLTTRTTTVTTAKRICCFFLAIVGSAGAENQPVVQVTGGPIRGGMEASPSHGAVFKGIPFAQPPVGKLRWREPQPVVAWNGIRDATRPGAAFLQNPLGTGVFLAPLAKLYGRDYPLHKIEMSEDCLFLNIWTPEWPPQHASPVMFWIHGGSNVMGSGAESSYDGGVLAGQGVVVVTINYRLGVLGSFSHPELTLESPHHASGNQGLLDQIAALQWVKQNIAQFGGDPGRVTVFGESAGALNAGLLLCSPLASGLMQRVIMESGPVLLAHHPATLAKGEHFGERVALSLGVNGKNSIERMREIPAQTLIEKSNEVAKTTGNPGLVMDGWFVREAPGDLFAQGRQLPADFIIGNNGREMSAFRAGSEASGGSSGKVDDSAMQTIKIFYGRFAPIVLASFLADSALRRTAAADSWLNDLIGTCPGMAMASLHANAGHRAYFYLFEREIPGKGQRSLGAFHSLEVPYVFGALRLSTWNWLPFEDVDYKLSETVRSYWTNFAKTGNPNGPTLPGWREFDGHVQGAMEFRRNGISAFHTHSRPTYCDADAADLKSRLTSLK